MQVRVSLKPLNSQLECGVIGMNVNSEELGEIEEPSEVTEASTLETEEAEIEIDVNAALLEIMVRRTEVLDKLLQNTITMEEARKILESLAPLEEYAEKRRRRRKKS